MNGSSRLASVFLSRRFQIVTCTCVFLLVGMAALVAQEKKAKRAKQKYFKKNESKVFFTDVFDNLVGARPDFSDESLVATKGNNGGTAGEATSKAAGFAWSNLISTGTIENEIKALKLSIDGDVTTPSEFKGRGYLECRRHFSIVATLMAVINDYDTEVRWKEHSGAIRDVFSRSAGNAKVGTQQTYNESKIRKQDMQDIIGGANFVGEPKTPENNWETVVDRPPLMERLAIAFEEKLQPSIANEDEFKKSMEEMKHEAEILAMIAEVLTRDGMSDAGDETYDGYAKSMQTGALDYLQALKDGDYAQARTAAGVMAQSCGNCHNTYQ